MFFEQIPIGGNRNFAYLIGEQSSKLAAVVDPAYCQESILKRIRDHSLSLQYVLCTHSDYDHIGGNDFFREKTGAKVVGHQLMGSCIADILVKDNEEMGLGGLTLKFLHAPGHTQDSICILVANKLITGDTLFVGKIGGTHSRKDALTQFESLQRLMQLPESIEVYPGHDVGIRPRSTIGDEKRNNPFLLQDSFERFYYLKQHWAEYKAKHGIK